MYEELIGRLREPCQYENCILCQQAADAIEQLSAIRDEQKAQIILMAAEIEEQQPRWVFVTERLPDTEDEVVVAFKNSADGEWWYRIDNFVDGAFCYNTAFGRNITHWMPLPEPPKEET